MSYWNKNIGSSSPSLDNTSFSSGINKKGNSSTSEFYEIEPAIVLDIILDSNHEYFLKQKYTLIPNQWPVDINGKSPDDNDLDYTWIGRALVRLMYSQEDLEKELLIWAIPLESNISEYPVLNEIVGIIFYLGQYFYTRKINVFNTPNANADFNKELNLGGFRSNGYSIIQGNRELHFPNSNKNIPYIGPNSKLNSIGSVGYNGALGRYFYYNPRIRSLKRREGDLIFESRFGQSIRFASYDDNRNNDKGYIKGIFGGYKDYKGNGIINPYSHTEAGGGNPMLLIRNRQQPLDPSNIDQKNVGGYIIEDINNDGSSIHMTSGITPSLFKSTCLKKMWGNGSEEQTLFNGNTKFVYPKLIGDQLIINSDRIIISAKNNEMFQYSKKRMSFVTDSEFTIDSQDQIVITTNNKTVINSPAIYLGQYDETSEPVLLGQTTVNWLYNFCNLLISHTHWYTHTHPDAQGGYVGDPEPKQTQGTVQSAAFILLREQLNLLLSRRVFVVGGGFAPGANGGSIKNESAPVNISTITGKGVPGNFGGVNNRTN